MGNDEMDKTKPIKTLNELDEVPKRNTVELEEVPASREEKYKEIKELEEQKAREEAAEEALAEKNIAEAESLLEQEKEALEDVDPDELEEEKYVSDKKGLAKLVDIWKHLDKSKKILYGIIGGLVLLLVILLIVALVILLGGKKKEKEPDVPQVEENVVEQAPEILSNYYYKDGVLHFVDADEEELGEYECTNKDEKLCYVAFNNYRDTFDVPKLVDEKDEEIKQVLPIYEDKYVFVFDNKNVTDKNITLYSISEKSKLNTYTSVKGYDDDYVIVADTSNKYGLIQFKDGLKELIKPQYTYLGMIDGEANLIAKSAKGYLVINKSNKIQSKAIPGSDQLKYYNSKMVVTVSSNLYTVYDYEGKVIADRADFIMINDKYAALVENGYVRVVDSEGYKYNEDGYLLKNKNLVKTFVYDEDGNLKETKKSFSIDIKGKDIAIVIYNGDEDKFNYLDLNVPKINAKYQYVNYFEGKLYFYKDAEKKNLLGVYSCGVKNEVTSDSTTFNDCFVARDVVFDYNDMMNSNEVSRKAYSAIMNNKYVFVKDSDTVYLYDIERGKALGPYNGVNTYTAANETVVTSKGDINVVALNKKGLYGLIRIGSTSVNPVYSFDYKKIEKLGDYYIGLNKSDKWVILSLDSSVEYPEKLMGYNKNKNYFKTKDTSYHVYDQFGKSVSDDSYEYVALYSDYYAGVIDKTVYVYDYEGNKLFPNGVKVESTNYSKTDTPSFVVSKNGEDYVVSVLEGSSYNDYTLTHQSTSPGEQSGEEEPTPNEQQ